MVWVLTIQSHFLKTLTLKKVFEKQRPGGEKMIQNAMKNHNIENLRYALENAKRIKLNQANPALFKKGQEFLQKNGG
jgi:hypothetical protein